jgi:peptidoglycan/xylan/chitin deacetylase (PgdA/CDA1 family)
MKKIIVCLLVLFAMLQVFAEGVLCLTFDDRHFANWCQTLDLFKKYDAHVTFFVNGRIDANAIEAMKKLQSAGHSIGLHSFNHAKAVETSRKLGELAYLQQEIFSQLDVCNANGIKIRSFAYPNSQRNDQTDKILFRQFDFLRGNCGKFLPKDGNVAKFDEFFTKNVAMKQFFPGHSLGGDFDMKVVREAMDRAAKENAVIVFYAHNITPEIAKSHHISVGQLEEILSYAASLKMQVKGLNEL